MAYFLLILILTICIFLIWKNYQLEKRWRNTRYCWHVMSEFAGERLKNEEAEFDLQTDFEWEKVVKEHNTLMRQSGARPLSNFEFELYESALLDRGIAPLRAHWS